MSIAFGGIVAILFRGMNLIVSLGLLVLCSNQLTKDELGTLVLGLTVVGIVNAATGGLTAATGLDLQAARSWQIGNAAVNRLLWTPDSGLTLVGWADISHLEQQARDETSA